MPKDMFHPKIYFDALFELIVPTILVDGIVIAARKPSITLVVDMKITDIDIFFRALSLSRDSALIVSIQKKLV